MLDIVRYLGRIFACRVNIVAATPKFPVPVFELQLGKAFVQLQAAFSLQEAHHAGHGILGRDFQLNVDMVRTNLGLHYRYFLPFAQRTEYFPDFQPPLSVKHLPPEFWGEHYVVFAVPARMSHCFYIFHKSSSCVVMQCTDHIVKLAGGFFITAKRLLGTTCLADGFRFIQK